MTVAAGRERRRPPLRGRRRLRRRDESATTRDHHDRQPGDHRCGRSARSPGRSTSGPGPCGSPTPTPRRSSRSTVAGVRVVLDLGRRHPHAERSAPQQSVRVRGRRLPLIPGPDPAGAQPVAGPLQELRVMMTSCRSSRTPWSPRCSCPWAPWSRALRPPLLRPRPIPSPVRPVPMGPDDDRHVGITPRRSSATVTSRRGFPRRAGVQRHADPTQAQLAGFYGAPASGTEERAACRCGRRWASARSGRYVGTTGPGGGPAPSADLPGRVRDDHRRRVHRELPPGWRPSAGYLAGLNTNGDPTVGGTGVIAVTARAGRCGDAGHPVRERQRRAADRSRRRERHVAAGEPAEPGELGHLGGAHRAGDPDRGHNTLEVTVRQGDTARVNVDHLAVYPVGAPLPTTVAPATVGTVTATGNRSTCAPVC